MIIAFGKHELTVPDGWDDLTPRQLYALARVRFDNALTPMDKLNFILCNGCGLEVIKFYRKNDWALIAEQLVNADVYEQLMWILDEPDFTQQLIPVLHLGGNELYGPVSEPVPLANLILKEWMMADQLFLEVLSLTPTLSKGEGENANSILNTLVGLLYRPKGVGDKYNAECVAYGGDVREKYNDALCDNGTYAKRVAALNMDTKIAVVLWYWSCRRWLIEEYSDVFGGGGAADGHPSDLILGVAQSGVFGDAEKTEGTNVHNVLLYLGKCKREAEAIAIS